MNMVVIPEKLEGKRRAAIFYELVGIVMAYVPKDSTNIFFEKAVDRLNYVFLNTLENGSLKPDYNDAYRKEIE